MTILALMRHGESDAGRVERFSGWNDTELSGKGRSEARAAGAALRASGIAFDAFYTSRLARARATMAIVLSEIDRAECEVASCWRLNERHYGSLQGRPRREVLEEFGAAAVVAWRREYRARPPALTPEDPRHPRHSPLYRDVPADALPATESLEDAALRVVPWWEQECVARLRAGANVLVVAHTASLRGITRIVEELDDATTAEFRVATCIPVLYEFGRDLRLARKTMPQAGVAARLRALRSRLKPTRWFPSM